jgi:membrane protein implicated in regulation of membrane protease activity
VNFGTVTAFMTWFGGVGFLLTAYSAVLALATIVIAIGCGVTGAGTVLVFMKRVLLRDQIPMRAADYYMPGTLARVTVTIPRSGSGEIVYTQGGSRKTAAARSADAQEIGKGTEVVVLRYERGTAHVRPWDQLAEAEQRK